VIATRPIRSDLPAQDQARAAAILLLALLLFAGSLAGRSGRPAAGSGFPPLPASAAPGAESRRPAVLPVAAGEARLDLNMAGSEELQRLPGIGPVLARRILGARAAQGRFEGVEDLRRVPGIGPKRFERVAPFVRVGA